MLPEKYTEVKKSSRADTRGREFPDLFTALSRSHDSYFRTIHTRSRTGAVATKFWTFRWEYYCQRCLDPIRVSRIWRRPRNTAATLYTPFVNFRATRTKFANNRNTGTLGTNTHRPSRKKRVQRWRGFCVLPSRRKADRSRFTPKIGNLSGAEEGWNPFPKARVRLPRIPALRGFDDSQANRKSKTGATAARSFDALDDCGHLHGSR